MDYFEAQTTMNEISAAMAHEIDYLAAWFMAELVNTPTKYKGHGRPRKTDYAIYKHPFDGQLKREINY